MDSFELNKLLAGCDEVHLPLIVLAELKAGFLGGNRSQRNEATLRAFLAKPTVKLLFPGRETAEHYARLFIQLKHAGTPIPDNDLWIAALCLEHDLTLLTRDRHFRRVRQLLLA